MAARKILESLKNWSGHGLSNRTGSAGPEVDEAQHGLAVSVHLNKSYDCAVKQSGPEAHRDS